MKAKSKILVVGSLNMDLIVRVARLPRVGESLAVNNYVMIPGGKGANQALACARLGAEVVLLGKVGKDVFGERIVSSLSQEGVNTDHVIKDPKLPTGMGLVILNYQGANRALVAKGANANCRVEDWKAIVDNIIFGFDIILLQLEIPLEVVKYFINMAKDNNILTILDPAPACPVSPELFRKVDILIPNQIEAEFFSGQKVTNVKTAKLAAQKLLQLGPSIVIVKLGEKGVFLFTEEEQIYLPPIKVKVVDTLGAGDAFAGALAVALARNGNFKEALRYANYAGALSVTKLGAQPSMSSAEEVKQFIAKRGSIDED